MNEHSIKGAPAVVVATTLDTKSVEADLVISALRRVGLSVLLVDCGVLGKPALIPDVTADEIAAYAGASLADLRVEARRSSSQKIMMEGLSRFLGEAVARGQVAGYLGFGGGTNTALASAAFGALPYGIPKLLVATTVAGDMTNIVDAKDVVLIHSVVDLLGTGAYLRHLADKAAAVMAALIGAEATPVVSGIPVVGITAFGATTPAASRVSDLAIAAGMDALVFHARGNGGRAAETFMRDGRIQMMLDLTTTEIADELVGGKRSAGPTRLDAAIACGIPQVVLPGALDIVNFDSPSTIPSEFAGRTFIEHTPSATLMRTSRDEMARIGSYMAGKLAGASAPVTVIVPMGGFSAYDSLGQPFHDPDANGAFLDALTRTIRKDIPIVRLDAHINDPEVADIAVRILLESAGRKHQQ